VLALHLPVSPDTEVVSAKTKSSAHAHKTTQVAAAKAPADKTVKTEAAESPERASVLRHKVKSGETLYSIANTYKTTVAALKRNNGNVATLKPGMILVVQQSQ
jgi:LysM repeat protein